MDHLLAASPMSFEQEGQLLRWTTSCYDSVRWYDQGHFRSSLLVPIETSCTISY